MKWLRGKQLRFTILVMIVSGTVGWASYPVQAQSSDLCVWGLQVYTASFAGFAGMMVGAGVGGSLGALLFTPMGWADKSCLAAVEGQGNCVIPWMTRGFEFGSKLGMLLGLSTGAAMGAHGVLLLLGRASNPRGAIVGAILGEFIGFGTGFLNLKLLEINERGFHLEFHWTGRALLLAAIGATVGSHWR